MTDSPLFWLATLLATLAFVALLLDELPVEGFWYRFIGWCVVWSLVVVALWKWPGGAS